MKQLNGTGQRSRRILFAITAVVGIAFVVLGVLFVQSSSQGAKASLTTVQAAANAADPVSGKQHYHPGRPAHIQQGACDNLGEIAFPLNPVGSGFMAGAAMESMTTMPIGERAGSPLATPMELGKITLNVPLEEITAGEFVLNVQISEFEYGSYIACGQIPSVSGVPTVAFGLGERNDSGFAGMAFLRERGDQTDVEVYLAQGLGDA